MADGVSQRLRAGHPLHTIGQTLDGRPVVGGLFALYDTYGYPFELAFADLRAAGAVPGLAALAHDARVAGWTMARLRGRLSEALREVYGADYAAAALGRIDAGPVAQSSRP